MKFVIPYNIILLAKLAIILRKKKQIITKMLYFLTFVVSLQQL